MVSDNRQAGAPTGKSDKIEITPAMIEAGVSFLHESGRLRSEAIGPDHLLVEHLLRVCLADAECKKHDG